MREKFLADLEWLVENLDNSKVKIVEAPWKADRYNRCHIKGAICLPRHSYLKSEDSDGNRSVHVCSPEEFTSMMSDMGIMSDDEVIVYDDFHSLFACRFWWVCNYYGFKNVRVLDGGWHAWLEKGYPLSMSSPSVSVGTDIIAKINDDMIIGARELEDHVDDGTVSVWDTRRPEEYNGTEETSNKRKGHIPGASNLEWKQMLTEAKSEEGPRYFKTVEEMKSILGKTNLCNSKEVVTHCQASIRGAVGSFVLEMLGYENHKLYDAAMAEWANLDNTPLEI